MASFAALILGAFSLIVAGLVGRLGRKQHRRRSLVTGTETTDVRAIAEEGLVELKGTVRAAEPFESPVRGEESALAAWEIEEWNERGESELWETLATGVYATPFALDDGTGQVRVEVGDHVAGADTQETELSLGPVDLDRFLASGVSVDDVFCSLADFRTETSVSPDADPPERIASFVEREEGVPAQTDSLTNAVDAGTKHGERRYSEGTVAPGQEIYLLGEARARPDATYPLGPEDVVVGPPTGEGSLVVSDRSEADLAESLGRYRLAYGIAAVLGVVGVAALLVGTGVVGLDPSALLGLVGRA